MKNYSVFLPRWLVCVLLLAGIQQVGQAAQGTKPYLDYYPVNRLLKASDVSAFSADTVRMIRNAIYARRGRTFKDPKLRQFFNKQAWYRENANYHDNKLSTFDKRNAEFLLQHEKKKRSGRAHGGTPGSNAAAEVAFLKALPNNATLTQVKKLLPANTQYRAPVWDQMYGNCIIFKGKVSGNLYFVATRRSDNWGMQSVAPKYHSLHRINRVELTMDSGRTKSHADTQLRINAVRKILGKPTGHWYQKDYDDGDLRPGWYANWKLNGGRQINCDRNGRYMNDTTSLSLDVSNQWRGAG